MEFVVQDHLSPTDIFIHHHHSEGAYLTIKVKPHHSNKLSAIINVLDVKIVQKMEHSEDGVGGRIITNILFAPVFTKAHQKESKKW